MAAQTTSWRRTNVRVAEAAEIRNSVRCGRGWTRSRETEVMACWLAILSACLSICAVERSSLSQRGQRRTGPTASLVFSARFFAPVAFPIPSALFSTTNQPSVSPPSALCLSPPLPFSFPHPRVERCPPVSLARRSLVPPVSSDREPPVSPVRSSLSPSDGLADRGTNDARSLDETLPSSATWEGICKFISISLLV